MASEASRTFSSASGPPRWAASTTQLEGERLQRLGGGRHLGEDVDAVLVLLNHPLQAADLALDPPQPLEVAVLVVAVPVRRHPSPPPSGYPSGVSRPSPP